MKIPDFTPGNTFDFYRTFLTVDREAGRITISTKQLNFFERILRTLFSWAGAYKNTVLTHKDIVDIAKQARVQLSSIKASEPLYKQILAIKKIAEENAISPPPATPTTTSPPPAVQIVNPSTDATAASNKLAADARIQAKTQNLAIVGPSRSGKTTLMNMIKDVCYVGGEMTMYYGTATPELHKSTVHEWNFNTLDTPGWLEKVDPGTGKQARSNETIVELIRGEVANNFEGDKQDPFRNVDTIMFTFTIKSGINSPEVAFLKEFLNKLPEGKKKLLVITYYESALPTARADAIKMLKAHEVMGELLDNHFEGGKNVLLSGCLDKSRFLSRSQTERMEKTLNQQNQALMAALLPESAIGREEFLINHANANKARITQFTAMEFEKEREECMLAPGQRAIDRAEKMVGDIQKALVNGKLPQAKREEFNKAVNDLEDYAAEIAWTKEQVEREETDLLDKITAQEGRLTQARQVIQGYF